MKPFISVIMPVYNASKTIRRAVESVLNQTNEDWELVCIDDGSSDDSLRILIEYESRDNRIKVFHQENSGPGMARNYAIRMSSGEYIGFLDSDDAWNDQFVEELKKHIEGTNSDIVILGTVLCKGRIRQNAFAVNAFINYEKKDIISCMMSGIIPWGMEKVIRASLITDSKAQFSSDPVGEECVFSFDCLYHSKNISFIDKPMYYYYANGEGQHIKGELDPWFNIVCKMKQHLTKLDLYNEYHRSVNSLAMRSFCIMVYRICCNFKPFDAKKIIIKKEKEYARYFDLENYYPISIDKKTKLIYGLWKNGFFSIIYIAAKTRKVRNQNVK